METDLLQMQRKTHENLFIKNKKINYYPVFEAKIKCPIANPKQSERQM